MSEGVNIHVQVPNTYHECSRELFAAAGHHVMQDHWVLGDVHVYIANSDERTVLGLGFAGQAGVQALTLANGHTHHRPAQDNWID